MQCEGRWIIHGLSICLNYYTTRMSATLARAFDNYVKSMGKIKKDAAQARPYKNRISSSVPTSPAVAGSQLHDLNYLFNCRYSPDAAVNPSRIFLSSSLRNRSSCKSRTATFMSLCSRQRNKFRVTSSTSCTLRDAAVNPSQTFPSSSRHFCDDMLHIFIHAQQNRRLALVQPVHADKIQARVLCYTALL